MSILLKPTLIFCFLFFVLLSHAQTGTISGKVISEGKAIAYAAVGLEGTSFGTNTDSSGRYTLKNIPAGKYKLQTKCIGFDEMKKNITILENQNSIVNFDLTNFQSSLNEVVVTGTLKEVGKLDSPVPVEVYTPAFFKKNPTPCIFDALQNVNGVKPQLNCNVCNTGDIHINGLEGPYTMILIDGMPIVSSLATVYGLSGIPNSLVERIEIVKGPASSLYGSEAVGGLINIITKKPQNAPMVSADLFVTTWQEYNTDLAFKFNAGKKATALTGINYFNYSNIVDQNNDQFTDVTLQDRISIFQKWNFERKDNRLFNLAGRFFNEERWGGDIKWTKQFRGGDSIYGESIYTKRWEFIGNYQLPMKEKILFSFSYNNHDQDSRYGTTSYIAQQNIGFSQLTWDKKIKAHDLLLGTALRYTFYDDNTPATAIKDSLGSKTKPQQTWLPGIFLQDEITITEKHKLLIGFRYDYNSIHGNIYTPRIAYKWSVNEKNIIRVNAGTGYRVVNLFTEDHAALTGARSVEIKNELKPETSYNVNVNYIKKFFAKNGTYFGVDLSGFYTYFNNKIIADYSIDPNKIIYDNLYGYAESKGISGNFDLSFNNGFKLIAGATLMDVSSTENGIKQRQYFSENFTGTWSISYKIKKINLEIDYTGNVYSPMKLPLLGPLDPRKPNSPWWSLQNIQLVFSGLKNIEIYGGIKNLLNWTPNIGNPFIIARANDPFDKNVQFDANGQVIVNAANPYGLTFDPTYMYGPNQGIRGFLGARFNFR